LTVGTAPKIHPVGDPQQDPPHWKDYA
jgi:hypothetical protein